MECERGNASGDDSAAAEEDVALEEGRVLCPGDCIVHDAHAYMRGKGTYTVAQCGGLLASVPGVVRTVNALVSVQPAAGTRYSGDVGDVLVGRIVDVQHGRWTVHVNATGDALLPLSAVNLPSGELRRKSLEDELVMRQYLREGDLLSAEVQQVQRNGAIVLHTRSLQYGKLAQGVLVRVPTWLVRRRRSHTVSLPCGVRLVAGCNGYVWLAPSRHCSTAAEHGDEAAAGDGHVATGGYVHNLTQVVDVSVRRSLSRVRNCVELLAQCHMPIYDTSIAFAFDASKLYETADLLRPSVSTAVAEQVAQMMHCHM